MKTENQREVDKVYSNPNHSYFNRKDCDHKLAIKWMQQLFAIEYPKE